MTRKELKEYITGRGSCIYRGRRYRAKAWQIAYKDGTLSGYNFREDDENKYFIANEQELLSAQYTYISDVEQLAIDYVRLHGSDIVLDGLADLIAKSVMKAREVMKEGAGNG